jgi:hypothetical protein
MEQATAVRVIATCSVLSTALLLGGALFLLNERYNWTGQLSDWIDDLDRNARFEESWQREIDQARSVVGEDKAAFLVRACVVEPSHRTLFEALCVREEAEVMSKDCQAALKRMSAVREEYSREAAAGSLKFVCRWVVQARSARSKK